MSASRRGTRVSPAELYRTLRRRFGPRRWWPGDTPFEVMVGAILTQNTAWTNVEKAIRNLRKARRLSPRALAGAPLPRVEAWIRPSGYFRQKAVRIRDFSRVVARQCGDDAQVCGFFRGDLAERREFLLSLKGIGPETADSMLLYAGRRPIFVVDAYTRRIGHRLGLFKTEDYHEIQRFFMKRLPKSIPLYNDFHAQLVTLGKDFCRKTRPLCAGCPVSSVCRFRKGARS